MKNTFLTLLVLCLFLLTSCFTYSQDEKDTQEFIIEKYKENQLKIYTPSFIFFSNNIFRVDAEFFANRKLSEKEFDNIFIYGADIEVGIKKTQIISFIESIDIRDITKVSTTKQNDNEFLISIYLSGKYPSLRSVHNSLNGEVKRRKYISKMKIQIGSNREVAIQLKKAIIHLGKLRQMNIKDGDLF
ncbi:hypothetical protein [Polaribacter atrinae]|nr:hypothetical protein [Polaribacter atrinae]